MTTDHILSLLRQYTQALDSKKYSHAHRALTLLADAGRSLPSWLEATEVEPAAEVSRQLQCGASVTLRNEDGAVVLVVKDEDVTTAIAMTQDEAKQHRQDVARIMAAAGTERAA